MRQNGTVTKWDDERGFGFIKPDRGGPDVFVHFSAMRHRLERPRQGARVGFSVKQDPAKGPRAQDVILDAASRGGTSPGRAPRFARRGAVGRTLLVFLLPALVLGSAVLAERQHFIPPWILTAYLAASAFTFLAYAVDKYRAVRDRWRISESTLHLFEMLGGWPGAFAAQHLFRHKNRKLSYQVTFWLIVAAHLAFWTWFARQGRA